MSVTLQPLHNMTIGRCVSKNSSYKHGSSSQDVVDDFAGALVLNIEAQVDPLLL